MKAAMYMRVGNKDQLMDTDRKEGTEVDKQAIGFVYDSLERKEHFEEQKRQINQYCSDMGLSLKTVYKCSKKDLKDRKAYFNSIIEENAADVDTFIIPSVSRISRKFDEFKEITENFREHGIEVVSLTVSESMLLDAKNPLHDFAMGVASGEIVLSGGYDEEEYEDYDSDYEESFKTNLPYGYELVDGRIVVDDSKREVVAWIFNATERYSNDVPDILVKQLQKNFYEELGAELEYEEAKGRVSFGAVEEYLCTELNVRLMNFDPEIKESRVERIKECLTAPLNEEQQTLIEDRFLKSGAEYKKEIIRHILMDSQKTSIAERRQAGIYYGKLRSGAEKTTTQQKPPKR